MAAAPQVIVPKPQLMLSQPGIQRDGTKFSQTQYISAEWCRFYQTTPRKMLGYRELRRDAGEGGHTVRSISVQTYDDITYVHMGRGNGIERFTIDIDSGLTSGIIDRTPAGFPVDHDHLWQFALVYDTANDANLFFAHPAATVTEIASTAEHPVFFGEVRDTAPLIPITGSEVSGGICPLWPYLLRFGTDGEVSWPVPGDLTNVTGTGSGSARPWGTKVVRGLPLRGTQGPAALLWHLDALTRCQFVGGVALFNFDTLTTSTAILSSNAVIEHAGIYYWATVSGFSMFNGVVQDIPNETNRQFFLDNLNWPMRQKVFVMKFPRWNEIWWCAPMFGATECNWAIIFNYAKGYWFDTPLPKSGGGFSAGLYEHIYHYPIVVSPGINSDTGGSSVWQHDFGLNEVSGAQATPKAIRSFYQTNEFNMVDPQQPGALGTNSTMSFSLIEPDFNQQGDLQLFLLSRANPRANIRRKGPLIIPAVPKGNEQVVKTKFTGRLTSFVVMSNVLNGYYEAGNPLFHWQPGDQRTEDGGELPTDLSEPVIIGDQELQILQPTQGVVDV